MKGKNKDVHDKHIKDRRKTIEKSHKHKKIQYRVKNELFVLYDYYQPVRIIGSGAYAVVWFVALSLSLHIAVHCVHPML